MRLFVSVDLPQAWKESLSQVEKSIGWLGRGVRWVAPETMHLTLKFLGETSDRLLPTLSNKLAEAASRSAAFEMRMRGTGVFPNKFKPRVYWVALKSDGALAAVQQAVDLATIDLGFPPDDNDFKPHLTLARIKEPIQKERITEAFLNYQVESESCRVEEIRLMRSHLSKDGARHEVLGSYRLTGSGAAL